MKNKRLETLLNTAKLIRNYRDFLKIRKLDPQQIVDAHGPTIREHLSIETEQALATVLVCAFNEEETLPFLLYSLHLNSLPLEVVVVDNASTDNTAEVARSLGATVITEDKPGLIHALTAGIGHLAATKQTKPILMTDADSYAQPDWAHSMTRFAEQNISSETGGQIFAPLAFFGSLSRDAFRTAVSLTLDYKFWKRGFSRPHGPNGLIRPSADGSLLEKVAAPLEREIVTGTDDFIHQRVIQAGGTHGFNLKPEAIMFNNGDRYTSLMEIVRTYLNPQHRANLYSEWHQRQPDGIQFSSKNRPKIGRYQ